MRGYVGDVALSQSAFTSDGFLRTGDIGYADSQGYLHIVDRAKGDVKPITLPTLFDLSPDFDFGGADVLDTRVEISKLISSHSESFQDTLLRRCKSLKDFQQPDMLSQVTEDPQIAQFSNNPWTKIETSKWILPVATTCLQSCFKITPKGGYPHQ